MTITNANQIREPRNKSGFVWFQELGDAYATGTPITKTKENNTKAANKSWNRIVTLFKLRILNQNVKTNPLHQISRKCVSLQFEVNDAKASLPQLYFKEHLRRCDRERLQIDA